MEVKWLFFKILQLVPDFGLWYRTLTLTLLSLFFFFLFVLLIVGTNVSQPLYSGPIQCAVVLMFPWQPCPHLKIQKSVNSEPQWLPISPQSVLFSPFNQHCFILANQWRKGSCQGHYGMQNNALFPKDVHVLILGTSECLVTWQRGIKVASLLTVKYGDYLGLTWWIQCNPRGFCGRGNWKRELLR